MNDTRADHDAVASGDHSGPLLLPLYILHAACPGLAARAMLVPAGAAPGPDGPTLEVVLTPALGTPSSLARFVEFVTTGVVTGALDETTTVALLMAAEEYGMAALKVLVPPVLGSPSPLSDCSLAPPAALTPAHARTLALVWPRKPAPCACS